MAEVLREGEEKEERDGGGRLERGIGREGEVAREEGGTERGGN